MLSLWTLVVIAAQCWSSPCRPSFTVQCMLGAGTLGLLECSTVHTLGPAVRMSAWPHNRHDKVFSGWQQNRAPTTVTVPCCGSALQLPLSVC